MNKVSFLFQGKNIVVAINGVPHTIAETHGNYNVVKQALRDKDWALVSEIVEPRKAITKYSDGRVAILDDDTVTLDGKPFNNALVKRLIAMFNDGLPIEPMVRFIENLNDNPNKASVAELYLFLESNSLPLTSDGHFLAYKKVQDDYMDCYTGKISNAVGQVVSMPREQVNADRHQTCSVGLHFCAYGYLSSYTGARIMVLKINPRDVVSIPSDYSNQKGRACRYEVVDEIKLEQAGRLDSDVLSTKTVADNMSAYQDNQQSDDAVGELGNQLQKLTLPEKKRVYNALVDKFGGTSFTANRFRDHGSANKKLQSDFSDGQIETMIEELELGKVD